jgi:hypothetical protein
MGRHTQLAAIEAALLDVAKGYDYTDVDFTTEDVGRTGVRLDVACHTPEDRSAGLFHGTDTYVYRLDERTVGDEPVGYRIELLGQREGGKIVAVVEDDLRECAEKLGEIAAKRLFGLRYA